LALSVLHLIESLRLGGAERALVTNVAELKGLGVGGSIVTLFEVGSGPLTPHDHLLPVHHLAGRGDPSRAVKLIRLLKLVRAARPDVIHTHLFTADILGRLAGAALRVPVVSTFHNSDYSDWAYSPEANNVRGLAWKLRASAAIERVTLGACSAVTAVSEDVLNDVHTRYPLSRRVWSGVIYDPIAPPVADAMSREEARGSLDLDPAMMVILHVGRVTPQKGLTTAIQALPGVLAEFPTAQLVSIGSADATHQGALVALAGRLAVSDHVRFCGPRLDVARLWAAADVFVFPSLSEGLGMALLEAMASALPCVASATPAQREIGAGPLLFPVGDAAALTSELVGLLSDPERRQAIGIRCRSLVDARFSPSRVANEWLELYSRVSRGARVS
jgi:glycosyltransferase involved in cell wall biosynthesis